MPIAVTAAWIAALITADAPGGIALVAAVLGSCIHASPRLSGALAPAGMLAPPGSSATPWSGVLAMSSSGRTPAYSTGSRSVSAAPAARGVEDNARIDPDFLPPDWITTTRAVRESRIENALHRGLDISASLSLLILTLPLLLVVAIAIKLDSAGPVFYRQVRVGRGGRPFTILKFRSMTADAEGNGSAVWASVKDPRTTRIGQFLRLSRIDEIPQVVNILRGDMAFVGPRPERPAFVEQLAVVIPHYADRAVVRPGLTGWAQVRFPYGASVEDARSKLSFDLYYIANRSIWLDLRIVLATFRVVLVQAGAR